MICRDPLSKEKQNPDSVKSEIIILTIHQMSQNQTTFSRVRYFNKSKAFTAVDLERRMTIHEIHKMYEDKTPKDMHEAIKFDDILYELSSCFDAGDTCVIVPRSVNMSSNDEILNQIKRIPIGSAQAQRQALDDFVYALRRFPSKVTGFALEQALTKVFCRMKTRIIDNTPSKDVKKYYEKQHGLFGVPVKPRADLFKSALDAHIRQWIADAIQEYDNHKCCKVLLLVEKYLYNNETKTLDYSRSYDAFLFNFKINTVERIESDFVVGSDEEPRILPYDGLLIDGYNILVKESFEKDYMLQDRVKELKLDGVAEEGLKSIFDVGRVSREEFENPFALKLYQYTEQMERDHDMNETGILRIRTIMYYIDLMMNGDQLFGVWGTYFKDNNLYKTSEAKIENFVQGQGYVPLLKNSLLTQLKQFLEDTAYENLDQKISVKANWQKLAEDKILFDENTNKDSFDENVPITRSSKQEQNQENQKTRKIFMMKELFTDESLLTLFSERSLSQMITGINTVQLVGFTKLTSPGKFSFPFFIFQDKITKDCFFQLEQIFMVKYAFKHKTLQGYRKEILDMTGKNKNNVKHIYVQSYPHPKVEGTRTFEIKTLVSEAQMYKILLRGETEISKAFRDQIGDLLKKLRENNIITIHGGVHFNEVYAKQIQEKIEHERQEKAAARKARLKEFRVLSKDFDDWYDAQIKKGIQPSLREQLNKLGNTRCGFMYVLFIDDVFNPLQKRKLQQHMDDHAYLTALGKILRYVKCGFSNRIKGRLGEYISDENNIGKYKIPDQKLRLFLCAEQSIEQNFHLLQPKAGHISLKKMGFSNERLKDICNKIGYITGDNKVNDTEMYLYDEEFEKSIKVFEEFIAGCDQEEVDEKIQAILDGHSIDAINGQSARGRSLNRAHSKERKEQREQRENSKTSVEAKSLEPLDGSTRSQRNIERVTRDSVERYLISLRDQIIIDPAVQMEKVRLDAQLEEKRIEAQREKDQYDHIIKLEQLKLAAQKEKDLLDAQTKDKQTALEEKKLQLEEKKLQLEEKKFAAQQEKDNQAIEREKLAQQEPRAEAHRGRTTRQTTQKPVYAAEEPQHPNGESQ